MAKYISGYGNVIVIRHENGLETFYAHLSKMEAQRDDWVEAERKAAQYYTVKSGDTLSRIAVRYHTTINAICKLNNISAKSTLRVGQRLRVK